MRLLVVLLSFNFYLFGSNLDGYKIETIKTPENVLFHITGLDIDKSGNVYCATRLGEVWILNNGKWSRFAKGLHEPCGLVKEKDGSVIVTQKPEMTRLVDTDKDGMADLYLTLTNEWRFHNNYHEYNYGGVIDNQGRYVGTLNLASRGKGFKLSAMTTLGGFRGWAYRVSPDGKFEAFASGLRSPAGIGKNNIGELFFTDNQGDYVPTSTFHHLEEGRFYGHPISLINKEGFSEDTLKKMTDEDFDKMRVPPAVWIPQNEIANSPGNPEWNGTNGKFGPFENQFFVGDQSRSNIFRVSLQKVRGSYQGCVINFISGLQCGNIRIKFDPKGALWAGQTNRGWSSRGTKTFGLQKIVWDGKTIPFEILDVKLTKAGFKISFTQEIDPESVKAENIKVNHWWYKYSRNYGSPKVNLREAQVTTANLTENRKTFYIKLPLEKEKVYCLDLSQILSKSGKQVQNKKAFYTINKLIE